MKQSSRRKHLAFSARKKDNRAQKRDCARYRLEQEWAYECCMRRISIYIKNAIALELHVTLPHDDHEPFGLLLQWF